MKKQFLIISTLALIILSAVLRNTPASASANDFYFKSSKFDYYLEKLEDGTSSMRVEEELTAVFPDTDQNHGIERCIPTHYRGVKSFDEDSFKVTRNGNSEPYSTNENAGELCYRIGSSLLYVHGEQTYKITYTLANVILQPQDSINQELYWDTNGDGWSQKFDYLIATVHLDSSITSSFTGNTSCYVGVFGTKGSDATSRCSTSVSADRTDIVFATMNLAARENLTFDLEFLPDTFVIPESDSKNYCVLILLILILLWIPSIVFWVKYYRSVDEKRNLAKHTSKPVQYTPPHGFTIAEAGQLWLNPVPQLYVATLMELAVNHKIELERGEKKTFGGYKWKIHVKNIVGIKKEQSIILEILNGGSSVADGDIIEVKKHKYTSHLEKLGREFATVPESSLRSRGFLEPMNHKSEGSTAVGVMLAVFILATLGAFVYATDYAPQTDIDYILNALLLFAGFIGCFAYIIIACIVFSKVGKYNKITEKGIEISNYLDGLKEYMSLAEKDRIKFLHSVKTVDVSNQGIVKLWEKLLPYAILFQIEDSWMEELNKYYQMEDVDNPTWLNGATYLALSDFHSFNSYTRSTVSSSTAAQSSSSSGFSGGGGGGFSGGGGGGGGGGGW